MARIIGIAVISLLLAMVGYFALRRGETAVRILASDEGAIMSRAPKIAFVLLLVLLMMASVGGL